MRRLTIIITAAVAIIIIIMISILNLAQFGQSPKGERLECIKKSPNYVDGEFKNYHNTPVITSEKGRFRTMWDFMFSKKINVTPDDSIPVVKTDLKKLKPEENVLIWFGHSSYLIQLNGKTFLIDPVFSGFAGPFSFVNKAFKGSNYYQVEDMPEIDYLIISHDHYDHLDYRTIKKLQPKVNNVVCGLGVGQHFEYWGYDQSLINELDWYEGIELSEGMKLTATPARHYSGRGLSSNKTLWASYVLQSIDNTIYIGGDSGRDDFFTDIGEKFGPFDLVILEQGQYSKDWNLIHMLPEEVYGVANQLAAKRLMPVHNSKFSLSNHPWYQPLDKIIDKKDRAYAITPKIGEVVNLNDSTQTFDKWW